MIDVDESSEIIRLGVHRNQRTPLQKDAMYRLEKTGLKNS